MKYISGKKAAEILGFHQNTLRTYADKGIIDSIRTENGQRRYNIEKYIKEKQNPYTICYCRVSSRKQSDDLQRQVEFMQSKFPEAEIIKDIGSGINFKRKGLKTILERLLQGDKFVLVVAHKDRLARFGADIIEFLINQNGGQFVVFDQTRFSPEQELATDIINIIHVFSRRLNGLRNYKIKKDSILPKPNTEE